MKTADCIIVLADSQYLTSRSMQMLLLERDPHCRVIPAANRNELEHALTGPVSLIIIDPGLPDLDEMSDLRQVLSQSVGIPVLLMVQSLSRVELSQLTQAGIRNIVFKTATREDLMEAVEAAMKRRKFYDQVVMDMLLDQSEQKNTIRDTTLTVSETEIIRLIANGMTTKEIAVRRHISFHTVITHRKNIFRKAHVNNASELVMFAIRSGIIESVDYQI